MAEEVGNFPLDQGNTSALRGLEQSCEEVGRPRRLDDAEEDLRNPGKAREAAAEEERDASRPERIEDRVEITQDAQDQIREAERNREETQTREVLQESDRAQAVTEDPDGFEETLRESLRADPSNPDGADQIAGGAAPDPVESLDEGFQQGNTQTNSNRTEEFSTRNQIDDPEEAAAATNNLEVSQEAQIREAGQQNNEFGNANEAPEVQQAQLQENVDSNTANIQGTAEAEIQENEIAETGSNVTEIRTRERAEDAQEAVRNEPALEIPASNVEQIEEVRDPLLEAQDANPLRAPGPSEIRDEPDATAVETERGQNVSNLI